MTHIMTTPERLRGLAWELEQRNPRPRTSDSAMLRSAAEELERMAKLIEEIEARPSTIVNEVSRDEALPDNFTSPSDDQYTPFNPVPSAWVRCRRCETLVEVWNDRATVNRWFEEHKCVRMEVTSHCCPALPPEQECVDSRCIQIGCRRIADTTPLPCTGGE